MINKSFLFSSIYNHKYFSFKSFNCRYFSLVINCTISFIPNFHSLSIKFTLWRFFFKNKYFNCSCMFCLSSSKLWLSTRPKGSFFWVLCSYASFLFRRMLTCCFLWFLYDISYDRTSKSSFICTCSHQDSIPSINRGWIEVLHSRCFLFRCFSVWSFSSLFSDRKFKFLRDRTIWN